MQTEVLAVGIIVYFLLPPVISFCPSKFPKTVHRINDASTRSQIGEAPTATTTTTRKRRWRRRKEGSAVAPITSGTENRSQSINDAAQTPLFSKTFPRYRIDSSRTKGQDDETQQRRNRRVKRGIIAKLKVQSSEDTSKGMNPLGSIFSEAFTRPMNNIVNEATRKLVESLYPHENLRWISTSSMKNGQSNTFVDEDFLASAAFWRTASDIQIMSSESEEEHTWYLAVPGTTRFVANSLCDILNWYTNLQIGNGDVTCTVRVEVDSRQDNVPVVRFTAKNIDYRQCDTNVTEFPTAEDTERRTKSWVKRILVDLGICPFTKSLTKSGQGLQDLGVPVANIMYSHSSAPTSDVFTVMADTWESISEMVGRGPSGRGGVSSILLSAPGFDSDFELWAGPLFTMLETCVSAIQAEEIIGVVCFHPHYVTPDGSSFPGFGEWSVAEAG